MSWHEYSHNIEYSHLEKNVYRLITSANFGKIDTSRKNHRSF